MLIGLLVVYAFGVETLQWFFPPRKVELLDYLENLLGLALGTAIWRLASRQKANSGGWNDKLPVSTKGD